jgi:hypothetical protein
MLKSTNPRMIKIHVIIMVAFNFNDILSLLALYKFAFLSGGIKLS